VPTESVAYVLTKSLALPPIKRSDSRAMSHSGARPDSAARTRKAEKTVAEDYTGPGAQTSQTGRTGLENDGGAVKKPKGAETTGKPNGRNEDTNRTERSGESSAAQEAASENIHSWIGNRCRQD